MPRRKTSSGKPMHAARLHNASSAVRLTASPPGTSRIKDVRLPATSRDIANRVAGGDLTYKRLEGFAPVRDPVSDFGDQTGLSGQIVVAAFDCVALDPSLRRSGPQ